MYTVTIIFRTDASGDSMSSSIEGKPEQANLAEFLFASTIIEIVGRVLKETGGDQILNTILRDTTHNDHRLFSEN